jgi:hypothetical protein
VSIGAVLPPEIGPSSSFRNVVISACAYAPAADQVRLGAGVARSSPAARSTCVRDRQHDRSGGVDLMLLVETGSTEGRRGGAIDAVTSEARISANTD